MRHDLVLARALLDETLAALQRAASEGGAVRALGIGHAFADAQAETTTWRVAALRCELADADTPAAQRRREPMAPAATAALVVVDAGIGTTAGKGPPRSAAQWQAWLDAALPAWRLFSPAPAPTLLALWIDAAGRTSAALRAGPTWHGVASLSLPGAGMLRIVLDGTASAPMSTPEFGNGRYSRLAGALGADVLARWRAGRPPPSPWSAPGARVRSSPTRWCAAAPACCCSTPTRLSRTTCAATCCRSTRA